MFARMTWNEYYRYYLNQLQNVYAVEEASAITGLVFQNKTGVTKKDIITAPGKIITTEQKTILDKTLEQLLTHKPVQQITGETWFYNLPFIINEHVLIPRPETEELVKKILDENTGNISIIDIGSGSGCISIALKKNLPNASVTSVDVSKEALLTARQNAEANETEINFIALDFLNTNEWQHLSEYDIIVSNPPYIPLTEKEQMDKNVTEHEPHSALFVPDTNPLLFYKAIAEFARTHLKHQGKIYVETHADYAIQVAAVFQEHSNSTQVLKDISGKQRIVAAFY